MPMGKDKNAKESLSLNNESIKRQFVKTENF